MKKKPYFLLTEIIIVMLLVCSCSSEQKSENITGNTADNSLATVSQEQPDVEEDDTETDNIETHDTETDGIETIDIDTVSDTDSIISPDLNHNGIAEEIRLIDADNSEHGQWLEIWENDEKIGTKYCYNTDSEQVVIFLCTIDGEDHLLRYSTDMYQGVCTYVYELSDWTSNTENAEQRNWVHFDINFGSPLHEDFNPETIAAFIDEINELLSNGAQMLNTNISHPYTFNNEGDFYDNLSWLDDWEPEFIRDKDKSLLENLKDFQTTMTAIQTPIVPEEVDSLPITEPLEMEFYSGAGAWQTELTLNPDGSFVGDYCDADLNKHYVCQFHGQFGKVEKLTDSSWLLTLSELEIDTGHDIGEHWTDEDGYYEYCSSEPYGFDDNDYNALEPGAKFILYSPDATGHEPGTELYGALEFWSWMHKRHEFSSADDILGCWGLLNMESGRSFFDN